MEQIILAQSNAKFSKDAQVIQDDSLWCSYLKQVCRLRGEVFFNEGLINIENLTEEGLEKDDYDEIGTHFLIVDSEEVVGTVRLIELLSLADNLKVLPVQTLFRKLNLENYEVALQYLINESIKNNRKIAECSRLVVKEEHRRFKNIHSQVAISLMTSMPLARILPVYYEEPEADSA